MKLVKLFRFLIKILVCISIINARSTEIKRIIKKYPIADNFSNEDFEDQDNAIPSLEISRESEEPQILTISQGKQEIDSFDPLEDLSEDSRSNEIHGEKKSCTTTPKTTFMEFVDSNLQENFNVAEVASKMISVIGSLEKIVEDPAENLLTGKIGRNETKIFSNRDSKSEIDINKFLSKVNKKLNKEVPSENKDDSFILNRIEVNIAVDESEIKNSQTLKLKRKTKKVINPHLGEKKSYFKYKDALRKKEARQNSLKEFVSKDPFTTSEMKKSK